MKVDLGEKICESLRVCHSSKLLFRKYLGKLGSCEVEA